MWVCSRTPESLASPAASASSSRVTEKGEHGATPILSIESGDGSWNFSIAAWVAAMIASRSSTTSSGGRPPALAPRSIEPRVGWNRRPTSRAASTVAASRSPPPAGNR